MVPCCEDSLVGHCAILRQRPFLHSGVVVLSLLLLPLTFFMYSIIKNYMFICFLVWLVCICPSPWIYDVVILCVFLYSIGDDFLEQFPHEVQKADGSVAGWVVLWFVRFWNHLAYGMFPFLPEVS